MNRPHPNPLLQGKGEVIQTKFQTSSASRRNPINKLHPIP